MLAAAEVHAQAVEVPLRWDAPPTCPDVASVLRRVDSLRQPAARGAPSRLLQARATVTHEAAWRLLLHTETRAEVGERTLSGASCAEVAEAAALILALAADGSDGSPDAPPPVEQLAPPPPVVTPAPPPPAALSPAPPARPRVAAWRVHVRAEGLLDVGTLPAVAPGASVALGVSRGRWRAELAGLVLVSQRAEVTPGVGGDIGLAGALLRGCFALVHAGVSLDACAAFEGGWMSGQGVGVVDAQRDGGARWAARVGLAARVRITGSVRLRAALEPGVAFVTPTFVVTHAGVVYDPSPWFAQLFVGLEAGD